LEINLKDTWKELPLSNEVIEQVQRLGVAAEEYKGIVFTDISGNILTEQDIDYDQI